jgi:hypothetical protein
VKRIPLLALCHRACADRSRAYECSARDLAMGRFTLSAPHAFRLKTTPRRYLEGKEITFASPRRSTARITFDDSSPDTDFGFPRVRQEATVPRASVSPRRFPNSRAISRNPSACGIESLTQAVDELGGFSIDEVGIFLIFLIHSAVFVRPQGVAPWSSTHRLVEAVLSLGDLFTGDQELANGVLCAHPPARHR